jgi:hypothetical protein
MKKSIVPVITLILILLAVLSCLGVVIITPINAHKADMTAKGFIGKTIPLEGYPAISLHVTDAGGGWFLESNYNFSGNLIIIRPHEGVQFGGYLPPKYPGESFTINWSDQAWIVYPCIQGLPCGHQNIFVIDGVAIK